jgi:hypothetical protein
MALDRNVLRRCLTLRRPASLLQALHRHLAVLPYGLCAPPPPPPTLDTPSPGLRATSTTPPRVAPSPGLLAPHNALHYRDLVYQPLRPPFGENKVGTPT